MSKPVVIIGAGPAGLSCASRLVARGESVVLIDDNLRPGGQYFRQLPPTYAVSPDARLLRETGRAETLMKVLESPALRYLPATTAWASPEPLSVDYAGNGEAGRIEAKALVVATGAYDRPLPFPGWTLPGVISAGGCLNLAKGAGLVPEGKVVVAGNGPLVLVVAATLAAAGADVTHVLEAQPTRRVAARLWRHALGAPSLVAKGLGYRARLMKAGVRFLSGTMVARAIGDGAVEGVEFAGVDERGRPSATGRRATEAATLVTGYGLVPSAEFSRLIGCRMRYSRALGGWVAERSDTLQTSLPGVYAVGDGAGIGGVEVALIEGALAAEAITDGRCDAGRLRAYSRLDRFRTALSESYETAQPLAAAEPDTIVCRCEELRLKELDDAFDRADGNIHRLKAGIRLGMGRCQGRNCQESAAALLGLGPGGGIDDIPRIRPPARPVRIGDLVKNPSIGPARIPDEAGPSFSEGGSMAIGDNADSANMKGMAR